MKQQAGWTAALLAAIGATIGISTFQTRTSPVPATLQKPTVAAHPATGTDKLHGKEQGPCDDLKEHLQTFFFMPADQEIPAPDSCNRDSKPVEITEEYFVEAKKFQEEAKSVRFVIATLPDPLHTHLPLSFDRDTEAIQQAAQDEGYEYDSSWLPWETEQVSYTRIKDQDEGDLRKANQENQPGILLFRKQLKDDDTFQNDDPFQKGLVVFIVGEEATGGIHRNQFENAVAWIAALQPGTGGVARHPVQILGPSFSGSFPSLRQILQTDPVTKILRPDSPGSLQIFSGDVTSDTAVEWLNNKVMQAPLSSLNIQFRSFQQSDNSILQFYFRYLCDEKSDFDRLAIVSEDETAYGMGGNDGAKDKNSCERRGTPARFFYPRDISALRAAYQSQSIFSRSAGQSNTDATRPTLQNDLADPEGKQHDTIRSYSGDQTALSQEAELQQIVSLLRAHRSQYILLRSSNPLDQLFLAHYLLLAYPEGRIVIEGADLLLRRETGIAGLTGVMTLSTYPLLPWEQDWTQPQDWKQTKDLNHIHRTFTADGAEGEYIAARFLLHGVETSSTGPIARSVEKSYQLADDSFLPTRPRDLQFADYARPTWEKSAALRPPPVWLSVIGHGGFWPVAALDLTTEPSESERNTELSTDGSALPHFPMPMSMKILLAGLLLWAFFHAICCSRSSITVRPAHRAHFVRIRDKSNYWLILAGSILVALIPILLAWGYGEMSKGGELLYHPWVYRMILVAAWTISGFALCANVWIENYFLKHGDKAEAKTTFREWLKKWIMEISEVYPVIRRHLGAYVGLSLGLYLLFDLSLEGALNGANRIPTYWRSINLVSGVSPLVPLLVLTVGMYGWFWYALQGKALFGDDQPVLPKSVSLEVISKRDGDRYGWLSMLSWEKVGQPISDLCEPLSPKVWAIAGIIFVAVIVIASMLSGGVPLRSLGAHAYSIFFSIWVGLCISILLANAWQLASVWLNLRQMLLFLDKLPLRRTMDALKGFSWGSIWKMSGNILDVRQKLIYRQFESLDHLDGSLLDTKPFPQYAHIRASARKCITIMEQARCERQAFASWYSKHWDDWTARDLSQLKKVQYQFAEIAAIILTNLLIPTWREERQSLVGFGDSLEADLSSQQSTSGRDPVAGIPPHIRNAEELVCLVYLAFIQNILGRIRSLLVGTIWLFVAIAIALASYPFDPQPVLSGAVISLFFILGAVIVTVYSQMHRDATLSRLTNTNPGELGGDFWLKLLGFGIGPVFGLLATVFPAFASFFFSWLQPGVNSMR